MLRLTSPLESAPDWLVELHEQLWGRTDLLDKIIRTVTLDKTDLIELQVKLQGLNPSRGKDDYVPQDVLLARSAFLSSRNTSSTETIFDPKADPGCGTTATLDIAASSFLVDHVMDVDDPVDPSQSKMGIPHVLGATSSTVNYVTGRRDLHNRSSELAGLSDDDEEVITSSIPASVADVVADVLEVAPVIFLRATAYGMVVQT
jgi:hypothetical protein